MLDKVVRYRFGDNAELMGAWESARNVAGSFQSPGFVADLRHWGSWRLALRIVRALDIAHTELVYNSPERAIRAYDEMARYFGPNPG